MTRLLLALTGAALAGASCAPLPPAAEHDGLELEERRARLQAIPAWTMEGGLAVDTGEEAFTARFTWLQNGDRWTLSVRARGPFIRRGLQVDGGPDEVIVTTSDGERRRLDDPEQDLSDIVDWWLPVESLRSWLLGLPDPRYPADPQTGGAEVLTSLEQRLWTLDYESYQLAAGLLVPRRIGMRHEALEIRVTVLGWTPETVETVGSGASLGAGAGGFE